MKKNRTDKYTAPLRLTESKEELNTRRLRVGMRIRRERMLWGMTQEQFSDILGITTNYLGQIERGNRDLSRKMEDRMCETFHIDRNDLHKDEDIPAECYSEDSLFLPELKREEVQRLIANCSPHELSVCGQVIRYLILCMRRQENNGQEAASFSPALPISLVAEHISYG